MNYHLRACALNSRKSQRIIYSFFYGYALAICKLYTNKHEDAVEMLNDGFLEIFKEIHHFKPAYVDVVTCFKDRLRKMLVYIAIDRFRKNYKYRIVTHPDNEVNQQSSQTEGTPEKLTNKEIVSAIQHLSPAYRIVFNLFVIEGFSHEEIAEQLNISIDTSKSNLSNARKQLKKILFKQSNFSMEFAT